MISLEFLLDNGADINLKDDVCGCPLTAAVRWGQLEVVRLYLDRGADVNLEGGEYSTPLNAANELIREAVEEQDDRKLENGEVIKQLLIDHGAH